MDGLEGDRENPERNVAMTIGRSDALSQVAFELPWRGLKRKSISIKSLAFLV